jgi:hypothetical protein
MLEVVTMKEIDAIFAVTDALGIHRESLVIPLGPAARPIDEWLAELPALIAAVR